MLTFSDTEGKEWNVHINVDTLRRVKSMLDVNLMDMLKGGLFERLSSDVIFVCDLLYVVCKPQADQRSISSAQFGETLRGDVIEKAVDAMLEDFLNFCPNARDRKNLATALAKSRMITDEVRTKIGEVLENIDPKTLLNSQLNRSGSAPASSVSTQVPLP